MGYLSINFCLLQFLSSIFYSFQCTDILPLWLNIFLSIVFDAVVNGILFFISVSVNSLLMYRNYIDFCMLILYPAILLLITSNNFWVESLGLSIYKIMFSGDRNNFIPSFPILMPFISFSCLMALARTFLLLCYSSGECGHPFLFLKLEEMLSTFDHWVWC